MKNQTLPIAQAILIISMCICPQLTIALDIPLYGNWCGPGHPDDKLVAGPKKMHPVAISELDEGCQNHDYGYRESWPLGARSEVDKQLARVAADILTREEQWRYEPEPTSETIRADLNKYEKRKQSKLTEKEYFIAAAICQWFSAQEYLAVTLDTFRGDYRAIVKLTSPEGAVLLVAAPASLTKNILEELSRNASPEQEMALQAAATGINVSMSVTLKVAAISDSGIDGVYSVVQGPAGSFIDHAGIVFCDTSSFAWKLTAAGGQGSWELVKSAGTKGLNISGATINLLKVLAMEPTTSAAKGIINKVIDCLF